MKLTSFRLKDQVHERDLDALRLITKPVEEILPLMLRERLERVRAER